MSCVNQVYDTSNANFQASVTIPSGDGGGEILGGYDASLNQLIFAYENICDPAKVTDLTSGWTSPYVSNKNKIGLDSNCGSTSVPILFVSPPSDGVSDYKDFNIKQMAILTDPVLLDQVVVCGGTCSITILLPIIGAVSISHGFLYSFELATGLPYTQLDTSFPSGIFGWFIKSNGNDTENNFTEINTIYIDYNKSGNTSTIIYGGAEQVDTGSGIYKTRPLLEKKVIASSGVVSTTSLPATNFSGYINSVSIQVVDITPSVSGNTNNCLVIYQTEDDNNENDNVHIRELDFVDGAGIWKTPDFHLPILSTFTNLNYTSSCIGESAIYIAADAKYNAKTPFIYAIGINSGVLALIPMFAPNPPDPFNNSDKKGVQVYNRGIVDWTGLQIDNISYITMNTMSGFVGVNTNTLFVTLSSVDSPQTKYISFISALTGSSQPPNSIPFNNPNSNILNALISQDSPTSTNDTIILTKNNQNLIQVELDNKLAGTLNDLHFKLAFCSSKLHLFAFGNYVNSPSNASVSSFALLNAISWICLSKGTQILCDQGIINIEKINTRKHTINNKPINHITQSIHTDDYLIKIKKNCLSSNSPSSDIICSGDHKILYKNNLIESKNLINKVYGVEKIKNDKRVLYNILMDKHEVIMANNTPVESLHPQNIMALFYNNYNNPQAREFLSDKIGQTNNHNIHVNKINKNKLNGLMVGNKISKKMSLKM